MQWRDWRMRLYGTISFKCRNCFMTMFLHEGLWRHYRLLVSERGKSGFETAKEGSWTGIFSDNLVTRKTPLESIWPWWKVWRVNCTSFNYYQDLNSCLPAKLLSRIACAWLYWAMRKCFLQEWNREKWHQLYFLSEKGNIELLFPDFRTGIKSYHHNHVINNLNLIRIPLPLARLTSHEKWSSLQ